MKYSIKVSALFPGPEKGMFLCRIFTESLAVNQNFG